MMQAAIFSGRSADGGTFSRCGRHSCGLLGRQWYDVSGCFEIALQYRSKGIEAALLNSVCGGAMQEGSEIKGHDEER